MKSEKYEDVFSVLSDLDTSTAEMEDVQNLLALLDELIDAETEKIRNDQTSTGYIAIFAARLPLVTSMLSTIRFRFTDVLAEMKEAINVGYELAKDGG